jgi:hypothetical protein
VAIRCPCSPPLQVRPPVPQSPACQPVSLAFGALLPLSRLQQGGEAEYGESDAMDEEDERGSGMLVSAASLLVVKNFVPC